jgi:hypothetical protein
MISWGFSVLPYDRPFIFFFNVGIHPPIHVLNNHISNFAAYSRFSAIYLSRQPSAVSGAQQIAAEVLRGKSVLIALAIQEFLSGHEGELAFDLACARCSLLENVHR